MVRLFRSQTVQYVDAEGRRVSRGTPGARKRVIKSKKWYGKWKLPSGRWEARALSANKKSAATMLAAKTIEAERAGIGLHNPYEDHLDRPLAEHVADYVSSLRAHGRSRPHLRDTETRVRRMLEAAQAWYWKQLTRFAVERAYGGLRAGEKPMGIRTANHHLTAVKMFANWMVDQGRAPFSPLAKIKLQNADVDQRHPRRALTVAEWENLYATTFVSRRPNARLSGRDRAMLYLVAVTTSWRARGLSLLTPSDFRLDASPHPFVTLPAHASKNKKPKTLILPPVIVDILRPYLAGRDSAFPVWPGKWLIRAAPMFHDDLKEAGIPRHTPDGSLDFHCLRNTAITWMLEGGTPITVVQAFAGHSTPVLTARYAKHKADLVDAAVAQLPAVRSLSAHAKSLSGATVGRHRKDWRKGRKAKKPRAKRGLS